MIRLTALRAAGELALTFFLAELPVATSSVAFTCPFRGAPYFSVTVCDPGDPSAVCPRDNPCLTPMCVAVPSERCGDECFVCKADPGIPSSPVRCRCEPEEPCIPTPGFCVDVAADNRYTLCEIDQLHTALMDVDPKEGSRRSIRLITRQLKKLRRRVAQGKVGVVRLAVHIKRELYRLSRSGKLTTPVVDCIGVVVYDLGSSPTGEAKKARLFTALAADRDHVR